MVTNTRLEDLKDVPRDSERPRGLYHISEVIQEVVGTDTLAALRFSSVYERLAQYHGKQGGQQ